MSDIKDTPVYRVNRRKIYKWIFRLLQEHHERLGLKVLCWTGPEGIHTPRYSLYFETIRNPDGEVVFEFELAGRPVNMHLYQAEVGIWRHDGEIIRPNKDQCTVELRTTEIMPWLNESLQIVSLYQKYEKQLFGPIGANKSWPILSKKYLLSWELLSRFMASLTKFVPLVNFNQSPGQYPPEYVVDSGRFLPEASDFDVLVFFKQETGKELYWLHTGKLYRRNGECLDFYQMHFAGTRMSVLDEQIRSFIGDLYS